LRFPHSLHFSATESPRQCPVGRGENWIPPSPLQPARPPAPRTGRTKIAAEVPAVPSRRAPSSRLENLSFTGMLSVFSTPPSLFPCYARRATTSRSSNPRSFVE
jgi:hypothetical protein